jgi:hypothetical protein
MMFDPIRICEVLNDEGVDYVIVGGFASVAHGSSLPTQDIDVVPSRHADNLDRLSQALRRLNAMIRTSHEPVPVPIDGAFLANMPLMLNLVTDCGDIDLTFRPSERFGVDLRNGNVALAGARAVGHVGVGDVARVVAHL